MDTLSQKKKYSMMKNPFIQKIEVIKNNNQQIKIFSTIIK